MKLYRTRTTNPGADKATELYFDSMKAAEKYLSNKDNGEVKEEDINIKVFPGNGSTWNEIEFYN